MKLAIWGSTQTGKASLSFNFENYYGNPSYYYSSSYKELDDFKNEFFKCNPIQVDVNKYIKSQESIYNTSIIEGLKTTVPARSTLSDETNYFRKTKI